MKQKQILVGLISLPLLLAGCTTIDPETRTLKTSNATVGASIGAVGGALLGAMSGGHHSSRNVLLGAGIGALAGGVVGNSMDQQEAMLRERLECTGVSVERCGETIRLIMPCDITFANDSACIRSEFHDTIDSVAIVLRKYNRTLVKIAGYTSDTGSVMHNQLLSERRARAVADCLADSGVNVTHIVAVGYGLRNPVASNDTQEGQALNRRVEITLRQLRD
jgi:outer membrane protein OmpA-like peptidoglycan-associated protein